MSATRRSCSILEASSCNRLAPEPKTGTIGNLKATKVGSRIARRRSWQRPLAAAGSSPLHSAVEAAGAAGRRWRLIVLRANRFWTKKSLGRVDRPPLSVHRESKASHSPVGVRTLHQGFAVRQVSWPVGDFVPLPSCTPDFHQVSPPRGVDLLQSHHDLIKGLQISHPGAGLFSWYALD